MRENTLNKMNKWDEFRMQRTIAIRKYVDQRKLMIRARQFIISQTCLDILNKLNEYFRQHRKSSIDKMRMRWAVFRIIMKLKLLLKKTLHADAGERQRLRLRYSLSVGAGVLLHFQQSKIAGSEQIVPFLRELEWRFRFGENCTEFGTIIKWI